MSSTNLLTTSQVAARLGVNRTTVHRWAERGDIAVAETVASIRLFDPAEIDRFLAQREAAKAEQAS